MSNKKMNNFIHWHSDLCTGCLLCEMVCAINRSNAHCPTQSAIRMVKHDIRVCHQCKEQYCINACKKGAIGTWDKGGIDSEKCIGCGLCVKACPHGAIFQNRKKTVPIRCNLCGGAPECVAICPNGALLLSGDGLLPALSRRFDYAYKCFKTEMALSVATLVNYITLRLGAVRIRRILNGKPDTLLNRLILTPIAKPFEATFPFKENKKS